MYILQPSPDLKVSDPLGYHEEPGLFPRNCKSAVHPGPN
jgi:hypothetical protein